MSDRAATPDDRDLLAQAARLCGRAGRPAPRRIDRLAGGKNNRVYRLTLEDGDALVLKSYFQHAQDQRDRLGAEWRFLDYAWRRGVRCVPEPLARDAVARLGLLGFVAGEKLAAGSVTGEHVDAAADFVCAVNAAPRSRDALAPGSEACFSIGDHLRRVDRRIERLATLDPEAPHADAAARLVERSLKPLWAATRARIEREYRAAGEAVDAPLPDHEIIASPSDFGFHNALWQPGRGLGFLDFEYAGWDDPAKLAGDFFSCPEIPAPPRHFGRFVDGLGRRLGLPGSAVARMHRLRNAYRLKWACIVLNDFLPRDDARRRFADPGDRAARCAAQLGKAAALIDGTVPS